MADSMTHGERKGRFADNRDAAADERDAIAERRDEAARVRDDKAERRNITDVRDANTGAEQHQRLRTLILEHFARIENGGSTPDAGDGLPPDVAARLRAFSIEQRRLNALDRTAIITALDELDVRLHEDREGRWADGRERRAADQDRRDAAHDRVHAAGDRGQAAIEREQISPTDMSRLEHDPT